MLANETIDKWVEDGMSKQEATRRWYELARTPLREFRKDVRRDDIRELNMEEIYYAHPRRNTKAV